MTALLVVIGLALALSFFCTLLETVLLAASLSYLTERAEEGERAGMILLRLREDPDAAIVSLVTLNTISHTLGASVAGAIAFRLWGDARVAAFCLLLTLGVLIAAELVPKSVGLRHWKRLSAATAELLIILVWLMQPITHSLALVDRLIGLGGGPSQRVTRAEFEALAEIERRQSAIDVRDWEVVANVMNLGDVSVGDVMTPRTSVVAIPVDAKVAEAIDLMLEEGHLRIPVFSGTIDHVVGVLLARDLWRAAREGIVDVREIVRPPTFVPLSKGVEDLIRQMREQRIKMAIVLDEFGGTAGLVTLEDLIEEIVGEIHDEHEQEPLPFEEEMEGQVRVRGEVPLWEVNERFDLDLPEDVYDTLGGFVFGQLGRIPDVGDEVMAEGGLFRVVAMDGRRITRVAFERAGSQTGASADGDDVPPRKGVSDDL